MSVRSARLTLVNANPPQIAVIQTFCSQFKPDDARLAPERSTSYSTSHAKSELNCQAQSPCLRRALCVPQVLTYVLAFRSAKLRD